MTLGLRALARRLQPSHPLYEQITRELQQAEAGEYGERYIVRQLEKLSYSMDIHILHNIRLSRPLPIQLDVVVVTPYEVIIIESKNIRGDVQLKSKPRQMIRILDTGNRSIFNHPEVQLEEYVYGLQGFFRQHNVEAHVGGVIVFPFNNARIDYENGMFPVIMSRELTNFLRQRNAQGERLDVQEIIALLLHHHTSYEPFPLCRYYDIEERAIRQGVFCPKCQLGMMHRLPLKWRCLSCYHTDSTAHYVTLQDYSMLISNHITNKQAQYFLQINNRHIVKRILATNCYSKVGVTKQSKYQILP
ncbi:nuclease-related domain-containing protein [Lysinibacillus fusiformis]